MLGRFSPAVLRIGGVRLLDFGEGAGDFRVEMGAFMARYFLAGGVNHNKTTVNPAYLMGRSTMNVAPLFS